MTFYNCIVSGQQCQSLHFSDSCVKHYVAESVHVATGKQETVKEAQVCNESMKT